jgi:hypothetical protein
MTDKDDEIKAVARDVLELKAAVLKVAVKEALKEWLDEKWTVATSTFGKWALGAIAAAVLAAFLYLVLWANGWRQP